MLKAAHDAEEFYEDRGARISILAGRRPPRPDTLKQTDQPPISTKPLADGAGHTLRALPGRRTFRLPLRTNPRPASPDHILRCSILCCTAIYSPVED